jgi:ABC-type sugar transport system ATPase subunit
MFAEPSLRLKGITKRYATGMLALRELDLEVMPGELLAVVGPSGCGKSTLLRIIAGFERPTDGSVLIAGREANRMTVRERHVGMMFQGENLLPHLNVQENLAFSARMRGERRDAIIERTRKVAGSLGLSSLLDRLPDEISGGEAQRVALGRLLVEQPALALLDEPLSQLDPHLRLELQPLIRRMQRQAGLAMIYVTHDQADAMAIGDRIAVMRAGHIVQIGTPQEIYHAPASSFVAEFIGNPGMNRLTVERRGDNLFWCGIPLLIPDPAVHHDRPFVVGIRAESIRVCLAPPTVVRAGCIVATGHVHQRTFQGDHELLIVDVGDDRVACRTPTSVIVGTQVWLEIDTTRMHAWHQSSEAS